jgi:hypothetical protein
MKFYRKRLLNRRKRDPFPQLKKRRINPELIHAARAAKLIRTIICVGPIFLQPDRSRFRRIAKFLLKKVIKSDKVNAPGERNVLNGDFQLLEGYELNNDVPLSEIYMYPTQVM